MKARPEQATKLVAGILDRRLVGAACAGRAPLFDLDQLPGESETERTERHAAAARLCARCPVGRECAAVAAEFGGGAVGNLWAGEPYGRIIRRRTP